MIKIARFPGHEIDSFAADLQRDIRTFELNKSELSAFLNLKRAANSIVPSRAAEIVKTAWNNKESVKLLKTENDFYHLVASLVVANRPIRKTAYPMSENYFFKNPFLGYNLQAWASCVHKIYETVYKDGTDYSDAVTKFSSNISDDDERSNFLNWLKYYNHGEHLKYNNQAPVKIASLRKDADYSSSLNTDGLYKNYSISTDDDSVSDFVLNHDRQVNDAKESGESKLNYKNWKKKFNTALRRVDKILKESEDYIDPDKYEEIAGVLNKLDVQVGKIRLQVSASDISFRAAGQLKKLGFQDGASVLYKYAQEAAPPSADAPPVEMAPDEVAPETPAVDPGIDQAEEARKAAERADASRGKEVMKGIEPVPGKEEDEYKEIMSGNVSISDASHKLEQIAGTLSDRRIIRYLAEFDIMLDKVGIASMFPELAEAQAKLIESYSYALTRVTKMLGMLSNSKIIQEMAASGTEVTPGTGPEKPKQLDQSEIAEPEEPAVPQQPEVG